MIGGTAGGRFLNDVWRLDLDTLAWSLLMPHHPPTLPVQPATFRGRRRRKAEIPEPATAAENDEQEPLKPEPVLPPVAGHSLLPWQGTLLCIGGHTKVRWPCAAFSSLVGEGFSLGCCCRYIVSSICVALGDNLWSSTLHLKLESVQLNLV